MHWNNRLTKVKSSFEYIPQFRLNLVFKGRKFLPKRLFKRCMYEKRDVSKILTTKLIHQWVKIATANFVTVFVSSYYKSNYNWRTQIKVFILKFEWYRIFLEHFIQQDTSLLMWLTVMRPLVLWELQIIAKSDKWSFYNPPVCHEV